MLAAVLLLSTVLNFIHLDQEGYANTYYAAAVKSMMQSWHNFFFVSFDPGGFVAVDKPPLGLWLQTASAKLFGFSGVSILLPQAAAGVLSVLVLYMLVSRVLGRPAGILAALFLAVTPIAVVDSRNNTSDTVLILTLLLAALTVFHAVETGRFRWLLVGCVFVGLGFNIKELEAYLILPALVTLYAAGSHHRLLKRAWHLAVGLLVTFAVSFAWITAVDLTPGSQRPYVSDSGTNSELSLALGYNGFGRLAMGLVSHLPKLPFLHVKIDWNIVPAISMDIGDPSLFRLLQSAIGAQASWLLLTATLGFVAAVLRCRISVPLRRVHVALLFWGVWLLTLGVFFSVARFYHLYYLAILAPVVAALAGIGLIALWQEYRDALQPGARFYRGWMLPIALVVSAFGQAHILAGYSGWNGWLGPSIELVAVLGAVAFIAARFAAQAGVRLAATPDITLIVDRRLMFPVLALGLASLLVAPAAFAADSIAGNNGAAWLPQAGPSTDLGFGGPGIGPGARFGGPGNAPDSSSARSGGFPGGSTGSSQSRSGPATGPIGVPPQSMGMRGGPGGGAGALTFAGTQVPTLDKKLIAYLERNRGATKFIVATPASSYASLFILDTGLPVMAIGGYQGWDKILTLSQLRSEIATGVVRFFFVSDSGGGSFGATAGFGSRGLNGGTTVDASLSSVNDTLFNWIRNNCTAVPTSKYTTSGSAFRSRAAGFGRPQSPGLGQLYDCMGTG